MLPELFHIGPIPIKPYGILLAVSFLVGVWYVQRVSEPRSQAV